MIIQPKVRGFFCINAHPIGCARHVQEQIDFVRSQPPVPLRPKRILIIGASTGYGLASRIVCSIGAKADTFGIFYERPGDDRRTASPGWYNTAALEAAALQTGVRFYSMNGDAFSPEIKQKAVQALREYFGTIDCVIYSLAAPRRIDANGTTYQSVLKPIGQSFTSKTVDTDKGTVFETTLEPATDEEIFQTAKVMGGEDWNDWIRLLLDENLLAANATTLAYSYIGPEITWPIYKSGTIGQAKAHLLQTAESLNEWLREKLNGRAFISVNKAVVTQASAAIPVVPLYVSILFKVMKAKGLHEDCIQQMYRLFAGSLEAPTNDRCVRLDDKELRPDVQAAVQAIWEDINTDNLRNLSDFEGYKKNFLQLFGFAYDDVDYNADVNPQCALQNLLV